MIANLDLQHLLGIPKSSTQGRNRKLPFQPFYEEVKKKHPTKVLLVRVSSAYTCRLMSWAEILFVSLMHLKLIVENLICTACPPQGCRKGSVVYFYCERCHCCSLHCSSGNLPQPA